VPQGRRVALVAIAALAGGASLAALVMWALIRPAAPVPTPPSRFAIVLPPSEALNLGGASRGLALSPDGRHFVYRSGGAFTGGSPLMVRAIDELDAHPLAGIDTAIGPFFSPDSQWIGFFDGNPQLRELKKVSITGGPPVMLCRIIGIGTPLGASWGDDNVIVFATSDAGTGLWQVSANGGEPTVLTKPDAAQRENGHAFPSVLAGGRSVLFTIMTAGPDKWQVAILDRKTGQRKTLIRGASDAEYVAPSTRSEQGHIVYAAAGALRAARFDPARLEVLGDPVPVVEHVMMTTTNAADYAVSRSGTLVYVPGGTGPQHSLVWVDRKGREEPVKAPVRNYGVPRVSPDGTRVVVEIGDQDSDLWIWDLVRESLTRLTVDPANDVMPVWTRDSRRVIFASARGRTSGYNLYWVAVDGTGTVERLTTSAMGEMATSVTPDGTRSVGFSTRAPEFGIVVIPLTSPSEAKPLVPMGVFPDVSPDGRYLAYQSAESGRVEVYVRPFPQVERGRWQVSREGGTNPVWAQNGRELFYLDGSKTLTAVPVQLSGSTFSSGAPAKLFAAKFWSGYPARQYDVSHDGQRFLMIKDGGADATAAPASIIVVQHWVEELKRLVPTK
jgi:Tol biopolymer transport system component